MDLWIRSQDRTVLIKVQDIAVEDKLIVGYIDKATEWENLGKYASRSRAIEILEEIQTFLSGKEIVQKLNNTGSSMSNVYPVSIFIMPKE